jgi:hypothetical protein
VGTVEQQQAAREAFAAARVHWQRLKRRKKAEWLEARERDLMTSYFSRKQRDFWLVFDRGSHGRCELDDLHAWQQHFEGLLGAAGQASPPASLPAALQAVLGEFIALWQSGPALLDCLNANITLGEVAAAASGLRGGKAADGDGLTAECFLAALDSAAAQDIFACLAHIFDHAHLHYPRQFAMNKLTPVPKVPRPGCDTHKYRGIAVASIFSKLYDKVLFSRASEACERLGLRSQLQCGFRPGRGTLDALFTLRHCVDNHRHMGRPLFACFVDFEKAFDRVDRSKVVDACRLVGMHGRFLEAVMRIYDDIQMVVTVNGATGQPFSTYMGTKQGSELSPLLFGIFMEQLHKLIRMYATDAGPGLYGMRVPAIIYADDVTMLGLSALELQQLLDMLDLFCTMFGMRINISKTRIVVFRRPDQPAPAHMWLLAGQQVAVAESYCYLGLVFHATRPLHSAESLAPRAAKGMRAANALLGKCRSAGIQQTAFKCRLFDVLVEPVLSYGCHVWGPDLCLQHIGDPRSTRNNALEAAHVFFLRHMAGVGNRVHRASLLREFARHPTWLHWVTLAARFWERMAGKEDGMLHCALQGDISLMLQGCKSCWCFQFLQLMTKLGLVERAVWRPGRGAARPTIDSVLALRFPEAAVKAAAVSLLDSAWHGLPADPRTATSQHVFACTYHAWVATPQGGAPHLTQRIPFPLKQTLMRLRLGWHNLAVQSGRMYGQTRSHRHCPLCRRSGLHRVEDIMHFLAECPAYAAIRCRYPNIFGGPSGVPVVDLSHLSAADICAHLFNRPDQLALARALSEMYDHRKHLLSVAPVPLPRPSRPPQRTAPPLYWLPLRLAVLTAALVLILIVLWW